MGESNVKTAAELQPTVAYCGLVCLLCRPDGNCDCRENNKCGKRLSAQGCLQYNCCREKGIAGCWECGDAPCGKDMLAPDMVKERAFIRFIRAEGMESFAKALNYNEQNGTVYHRNSIFGDYDKPTETMVMDLLYKGLNGAKAAE